MYNYNVLQGLVGFGIIVLLIIIIIGILMLVAWILNAIGLKNLAKANNIENSWLAFLPVGYQYLLGKLGFEIYPKEKNSTCKWILFGISIASLLLGASSIEGLLTIALIVFQVIAFSNVYKEMVGDESTKYTILSVFFGSLPLFFNKKIIKPATSETINSTSLKEEDINQSSEQTKFCRNCGTKINTNSKFCSNCGKEIN